MRLIIFSAMLLGGLIPIAGCATTHNDGYYYPGTYGGYAYYNDYRYNNCSPHEHWGVFADRHCDHSGGSSFHGNSSWSHGASMSHGGGSFSHGGGGGGHGH
jgi:hypothetical protein